MMTYEKRIKLQVWGLILVVFVLGGAAGASIHALYAQRQVMPGSTSGQLVLLERMRAELQLTDQQVDQVWNILLTARKEMGQTKVVQCPTVKEVRERSDAKIIAVLNPDQRERFKEIRARRDAERAAEAENAVSP